MAPQLIKLDANRAMVAARHGGADERPFQTRTQRLRDEKIINAPPDVPRTRAGHRTPPSVMSPALLKFAERVHKTGVHKRGEAVALLNRETVVADVGLGIRQINFRVCHVEVAAEIDLANPKAN